MLYKLFRKLKLFHRAWEAKNRKIDMAMIIIFRPVPYLLMKHYQKLANTASIIIE
jgi:hypothetical protein